MWRVTIQCSAEGWRNYATEFKAIADKYSATPTASKKTMGDNQRLMEYQLESVSDTEEFIEECMTLDGFTASFESV